MHASYVLPLLAILPTTLGHFLLNYPDPLGTFDDDNEPNGPCGGYDLSFSGNVTNVSVSGFSVATRSTHPQGSWLFRYTTTITEPYNWTNILPVVSQSGIGDFCLPALTVPDSLVGQQAVIQVIDQAVDGNLYQCAAVNFISGSPSVPSACTNASGVTATITTQTSLDNSTSSNGSSTSSTGTSTSASATASSSQGAAVKQIAGGMLAILPIGLLLL